MYAIDYRDTKDILVEQVLPLYRANHWTSADQPIQLHQALVHSHTLITAWDGDRLVGLGNAISDGFLVVYYPHLLVLPDYQRQGIGRGIVTRLTKRYTNFHMQMLVADRAAIDFYRKCGFERASTTEPMWIYAGDDHSL